MLITNQKLITKFNAAAIGCIVVLAFLVYANSFKAPFVFDDFHNIVESPYLRIQNLSPDKLLAAASHSKISQRWVANLSFAVTYYFFGQDVWGYHLVNLLIHIMTGIAVFFLFRLTLHQPLLAGICKRPDEIALAATLLWLVHPIQTNTVTYIVQRMTSMAAFFEISALLSYIHARLSSANPTKKMAMFGASLLLAILALGCKENAAMLPIMVLAYEYFFISEPNRHTSLLRIIICTALSLLLIFILAWLYYGENPIAAISAGYAERNFTMTERLLTQPRVVFFYLWLLFLPLPSHLNINHDFIISHSLFAPPSTWFAFLGLAGAAALIVYLFKHHRLLAFALFWFLGNLIIESSIIPLEIIFEHRLYLPSMFLLLSAAVYLAQLLDRYHPAAAKATIIILITLLSFATWQRNTVWATSTSLWNDVVKKSPGLMRGHANLGKALLHEKRFAEAESELRKAIELDPESSYSYTNLAVLCEKQNRLDEALAMSQIALSKKDADQVKIHHNLGIVFFKRQDHQQALTELNIALNLNPDYSDAYVTLGAVYGKSGNHIKAEELMLKAITLDPGNGYAYQNIGSAYERQNRLEEAKAAFLKALQLPNIDPAKIHNNLGIVYWRLGDFQQSINHARAAIDLEPDYLDAYITLAITYEDMGKQDKAFEQFREAWKKGYPMIRAYQTWARELLQEDKVDKAISYLNEAIALSPEQADESRKLLNQALARQAWKNPQEKPTP
ncbi:MAG: hypothetical protein A2511_01060 [Deltaproteobacteria bacterium RIFOXYD12_FULL_50_9]|nr:MAG: hypothetical protein A2511_01060 [Deltaproteobacteria bacterium RIFOXYD12_FULL_50_9]